MTDTATGGESSGSSEETTSGGSGSETLGGAPAASAVGAVRRPIDGALIGAAANTRAVSLSGTTVPGATVRVYDGGTLVERMGAAREALPRPISPTGRTATRQR
jgi:hypothetical protein